MRTRDFWGAFLYSITVKFSRFGGRFMRLFDKTIPSLVLVVYEIILANAMRFVGYLPSHIQRSLVE